MGAILMLGVLISGPVVIAAVVWLLTGRGPYRWLGGSYAVVNPFPRTLPPDIVAVLNRRSS